MSLHRVSSLLAGLLGSLVVAGSASAAGADKVTICHFPPGNPGNFQTITIAPSALPAHLGHHDFGGPCENDCTLLGSVCDDGNSCTVDTCNADGTCAHSAPTDCNDGNPCTADSCDPDTGACVTTPVSTSTTCDDGNACTGPLDNCDSSGECHGAPIAGCCTTNAACNDQNPCTNDTCNLGTHTCTNSTKTCTPSDLCHQASCAPDDGTCVEAPIECDAGDVCSEGTCVPLETRLVDLTVGTTYSGAASFPADSRQQITIPPGGAWITKLEVGHATGVGALTIRDNASGIGVLGAPIAGLSETDPGVLVTPSVVSVGGAGSSPASSNVRRVEYPTPIFLAAGTYQVSMAVSSTASNALWAYTHAGAEPSVPPGYVFWIVVAGYAP